MLRSGRAQLDHRLLIGCFAMMKGASPTEEDGPYAAKSVLKLLHTRFLSLEFEEKPCPFFICDDGVEEVASLQFEGPSDGVLFGSL